MQRDNKIKVLEDKVKQLTLECEQIKKQQSKQAKSAMK